MENISTRDDLLKLTPEQQRELCEEIRTFLIERVSDTGGHLASNLGIVETTLAIHRVFDTARDRLVFDVGHQSYVHKILTGRMGDFATLRKFGGLSGFPKPEESVHDAFIAGHASNSVSVALGLARARSEAKQKHSVIALIGDGALTGGLAYEALNDAGASREPVIVVLNDNNMSIAGNVGGMSKHLALLRLKPGYFGLKKAYRRFATTFPGGRWIYKVTHAVKQSLKRALIGTSMFEEMGLTYLGPVDGHDIERVSYLLQVAKELNGPVLLHVITQKGRGYKPAEMEPQNYHGVGQFDPEHGILPTCGKKTYSAVFGEEMMSLAKEDARVCAITAAMLHGTGLEEFSQKFPARFHDVGIAEGHAIALAGGMAAGGLTPVVAMYSTFLQRGYDMLMHDVALMQNHVVLAVDRCGLVGEDGATHHGAFDVGYLCQVPGMRVYSPVTESELRIQLRKAVIEHTGPVALRYPRGYCGREEDFPLQVLEESAQITLVTYGSIAKNVLKAKEMLAEAGTASDYIRLTQLKPLDFSTVCESVRKTGVLLVVEETAAVGCIGSQLVSALSGMGVACRCALLNLGDSFLPQGSIEELYTLAELNAAAIFSKAREVLKSEE